MLPERLDDKFRGTFDFLYLPIDFANRCNMGYAFINFKDTVVCQQFIEAFHGVDSGACLPGFNSVKVCEVTYARVRGLAANVEHLRRSRCPCGRRSSPPRRPSLYP